MAEVIEDNRQGDEQIMSECDSCTSKIRFWLSEVVSYEHRGDALTVGLRCPACSDLTFPALGWKQLHYVKSIQKNIENSNLKTIRTKAMLKKAIEDLK